jgi:heptosyltransferase-2
MRIGVFLPNWVGDAVMTTPTLRALRKHYSAARLVGIMRPSLGDVFAGTRLLDEHLYFDPRSEDPHVREFNVMVQLRRQKLDVAVLLSNSWRTGILAWMGGARKRVGYSRDWRGWLLSQRLKPDTQRGRYVPGPVLDYYLELAYALGCPQESPKMELATSSADESLADSVWQKLHLPHGRPVITVNCSGAFGAAKLWPAEYFAELSRRIVTQLDRAVLVLCGPSERATARRIVAGAAHASVVSLADEPVSLGLTKACVRRSELLVTTDSGPRHFAAAFNVPAITLFGPTHQAWSDNHFTREISLQLKLDCSPCQKRVCPLQHHRCMRDLTVDQVYDAVRAQLGGGRVAHAA